MLLSFQLGTTDEEYNIHVYHVVESVCVCVCVCVYRCLQCVQSELEKEDGDNSSLPILQLVQVYFLHY